MTHMRAQFRGITGEIVGLAGIVSESVVTRRTVQAAFNRVFPGAGGRGSGLAAGGRS